MKENGISPGNPTSSKYSLPVFENYRRILSAEAEGKPAPQLLPVKNTSPDHMTSTKPSQQQHIQNQQSSTGFSQNSQNAYAKSGKKREFTDEELGWDSWGSDKMTSSSKGSRDPLESYYAAAAAQEHQQQQQQRTNGISNMKSEPQNAFFVDPALSKPIIPKSQRTFAPVESDGWGNGGGGEDGGDGPHELRNKDGRVVAMSYDGGASNGSASQSNFGDFFGQSWTKMSNFAKNVYDNSPSQANLADYWSKITNVAKNVASVNIFIIKEIFCF